MCVSLMADVGLKLLRRHKITERERALTQHKGVQKSDCNADWEGENKSESDTEKDEIGELNLKANGRRKIILRRSFSTVGIWVL